MVRFILPMFFAIFLQTMYGAVDLLVVERFAENADASAVSIGSQLVLTLTNFLVSSAMGITVTVGQEIGQNQPEKASKTVGTGIMIFSVVGAVFTLISVLLASQLTAVMNASSNGVTNSEYRVAMREESWKIFSCSSII